jgi:hypothetical protein
MVEMKYIYKCKSKYRIIYKKKYYGTYSTENVAVKVLDKLMELDFKVTESELYIIKLNIMLEDRQNGGCTDGRF